MLEENAIAGTKIIESGFSVGSMEETKTRTFAMTGLEPFALATLSGQCFPFESAELALFGAVKHLWQAICTYVAQFILWEDEVVAGIDIAVVFHDGCVSALFGIDTNAWFYAHPSGKCGIEELYEDFSYIVAHPFVKYVAHEMSPFLGADTEGGNGTVFIEEMCKMPAVGVFANTFYYGTYLEELAMQFVAEEAIKR